MRLVTAMRAIGIVATTLLAIATLHACDTPVYQYSMYEWRPDRYQVRYFHGPGETPAADAAANERLRRAGRANVSFQSVEVAEDGTVAQEHASAWRGHARADLPLYVVSAPGHGVIFAGRLDAEAAGQLLDSPKRREIAGELSAGRAGLLVVLIDRDAGDGERVLQTARAAAAEGSDGERRVGLVTIDRSDPSEGPLVRQLLTVEDDLADLAGSMVFGALGRGRVLPPFVGKGVTAQGMRDLIAFMHGPCACELKTSNPGLDLLIGWDWDGRLPQWAAGTATQPNFMLFDFQVDPEAEGSGQAAAADPDAVQQPLTSPAQDSRATQPAAAPRRAIASRPEPAAPRMTAPEATPDALSAPEPEPVDEPATVPAAEPAPPQTAAEAHAPPPDAPEPEAEAPVGAEPPAEPVRLVSRAPELPSSGQARLASRALGEDEESVGSVLAARVGVVLLVLAALAGAGHLVLIRRRAAGTAGSDGSHE